jgi:hypothetical protein
MMFLVEVAQCTQTPIANNLQMPDHGDDMIPLEFKKTTVPSSVFYEVVPPQDLV